MSADPVWQNPELESLLDEVTDGVYVVDRNRRILYWNRAAEHITGYCEHDVVSRFCHGDLLMHCDLAGTVLCGDSCPLSGVMADGMPRQCTVFLRHHRGYRLPVDVRSRAIRNAAGAIAGAIEIFQTSAPREHEDPGSILERGCVDRLTGMANRAYGELLAEQALAALDRFGIPFGWIRLDLDNARHLVHRYGHGVLEVALILVARTIECNVGRQDLLAYWGGGQFRVGARCPAERLMELARKLAVLVRTSNLDWWSDPLPLTVSIGVATAQPGDSLAALEARAAGKIAANLICSE